MKVVISGSSGLVGSALIPVLDEAGHDCVRLVREQASEHDIPWDPERELLEADRLEGVDAVVHLAGENIATGRWTAAKQARIRDSRVQGTKLVSESLASLSRKPATLVCASAIGYYGDRGDEICEDGADPGVGFLPDVCRAWEAATEPAREAGIRVVNLRIGLVLSADGGALAPMLLPFRLGLGGIMGNGRQYWSWISLQDLVRAIRFVLTDESLSGPVNAVAPNPVTNREFTKTLGRALHRPTLIPLPAAAARLVLGPMADALMLASARVIPTRLLDAAFPFFHDELALALEMILRRNSNA